MNTIIINAIQQFRNHGISALDQYNEPILNQLILDANEQYYNNTIEDTNTILTDNEYDIIKEYVSNKYPSNTAIHEIGAKVVKNKAQLPVVMPSMNKIKSDVQVLERWQQKFSSPKSYIISCKLDGVSGLFTKQQNGICKLYTRGDGIIGQDVSYLLPYLNATSAEGGINREAIKLPTARGFATLLQNLPYDVVFRGEFIMTKSTFETKYSQKFSNARNLVAGMINSRTLHPDILADIQFVIYEVIEPAQLTPSQQFQFLEQHLPNSYIVPTARGIAQYISVQQLSNILIDWRTNSPFEIDGIIVAHDKYYPKTTVCENPEHAFAFKMTFTEQMIEANVIDVIWTASKDGYLKPRVRFEPVQIGGVIIEYATGFNGAFIYENCIGIGSRVCLIRSGDVIPHIAEVLIPASTPKMPTIPYIWNENHKEILIPPENMADNEDVICKNISGFFRGLAVEGLGADRVERLVAAGYNTIPKILHMTAQEITRIDGFGPTLANKLTTNIHTCIQNASLLNLMSSSNIFGRGFGEKKLKVIMENAPNILISTAQDNEKIALIANMKMMSLKTAEAFVSKIDDFKQFLGECGLEYKLAVPTSSSITITNTIHPLYQKKIVVSGTRDKTLLEFLEGVGATLSNNVSKNTHLVIVKSLEEQSKKLSDAQKLGVPIMDLATFERTMM